MSLTDKQREELENEVSTVESCGKTLPDGGYTVTLSGVEREQVKWLWPGRVPLGMLTLLVGDPGLGKSLLTLDLAAMVSRAGADVLLLSAEDHAGATIRPRAETAGADLDRLHIARVRRQGLEDGIALPDDADTLAQLAEQHKARLVVVDPLTAHLPGSVNSWQDQSVRRALAPLHRLAEERRCAVIVVAHLNKAKGADPLYRTGGSIAIPAAVRSALLLARDPEDPDGDRGYQRVVAHHKCNVAELAESLVFRIEPVMLTGAEKSVARLRFIGTSETGASDLLSAPSGEERTERDEAADFLRGELAKGTKAVKHLKGAANDAGIAWRTVERAKESLKVEARKEGFGTGWVWVLPEDRQPHISNVAAFAETPSESQVSEGVNGEGRQAEEMAVLDEPSRPEDPPCRYPAHRSSDYIGAGGRKVCGVCHPRPGDLP